MLLKTSVDANTKIPFFYVESRDFKTLLSAERAAPFLNGNDAQEVQAYNDMNNLMKNAQRAVTLGVLSIFKLNADGTGVIPWDQEDLKSIDATFGLGKKSQEPKKSLALEK